MKSLRQTTGQIVALGLLAVAFVALVLPQQARAAGFDNLPEAKRTRAEMYLEAKHVPRFIERSGGAFVDHQELMTDWDGQRNICRLPRTQGPSRQISLPDYLMFSYYMNEQETV